MTSDSTFKDAIHASLKAMHKLLVTATEETNIACDNMADNQQNMAIGSLMLVEDHLEQAANLYKAIIAMHRLKL